MSTASAEKVTCTRTRTPHTVIHTDLYDLIAAVQDSLEPGEDPWVSPIVVNMLQQGQARWLKEVDVTALGEGTFPMTPHLESCETLV